MANFNTHLAVGAIASGLGATMTMAAGVVPQDQLLTLTMAGIIGSVLPDIDLEKAAPSSMLFSGLGVVFAFVVLFQFTRQYSIAELWLVWIGVYALIRYGLFWAFHKRTRHRGIFHSLLAGAFFAALTAVIFDQIFGEEPLVARFAALFVFGGYLVHLTLDEISSVDFEGKIIKKSFGSALKPFDMRSWRASLAMASALVLVLIAAPSFQHFRTVVTTHNVIVFLQDRLLPKGEWFRSKVAAGYSPAGPAEAGSLPSLSPMTPALGTPVEAR